MKNLVQENDYQLKHIDRQLSSVYPKRIVFYGSAGCFRMFFLTLKLKKNSIL